MLRYLKMLGPLIAVVAMATVTTTTAQATFTSSNYPASVFGTSNSDVLDVFGYTVKCPEQTFQGQLTKGSTTLTLTASNFKCPSPFLSIKADFTSCDYLLHKEAGKTGTMDISCSNPGDAIDLAAMAGETAVCHWKIPAQTGIGGFSLTNNEGTINLSGRFSNLTVTQIRTNPVVCPSGTHSFANYTIQSGGITLFGSNGAISVD